MRWRGGVPVPKVAGLSSATPGWMATGPPETCTAAGLNSVGEPRGPLARPSFCDAEKAGARFRKEYLERPGALVPQTLQGSLSHALWQNLRRPPRSLDGPSRGEPEKAKTDMMLPGEAGVDDPLFLPGAFHSTAQDGGALVSSPNRSSFSRLLKPNAFAPAAQGSSVRQEGLGGAVASVSFPGGAREGLLASRSEFGGAHRVVTTPAAQAFCAAQGVLVVDQGNFTRLCLRIMATI